MLVKVIDFVEIESQDEQKTEAVLEALNNATALLTVTQNGALRVVAAALVVVVDTPLVVALAVVELVVVALMVVARLVVALVVVMLVVAFRGARGPAAAKARRM